MFDEKLQDNAMLNDPLPEELLVTAIVSVAGKPNAVLYFEILDPMFYTGMFTAPLSPDGYLLTHWASSGIMRKDFFEYFADAQLLYDALMASEYVEPYIDSITLQTCADVVADMKIYYGSFADACDLYNLVSLIEEV